MVTVSSEYAIYLYREKVDLRKGINGLSGIVREEMRLNPRTSKSIYVFSGRNPRIKKVLIREYNRYELTQIRLDEGRFFSPVLAANRRFGKISWSDLVLLTEAAASGESDGKGRRSACLVHIRRKFVDALLENKSDAMWFIEEFSKMFTIEHYCLKHNLRGHDRLLERLKRGGTGDIMKRIEERMTVFRESGYAGCGELLRNALKYAEGEWPALQRVLESGEVELSNNLSEQMMRSIKMNLKNAGNIGSENSARHNAFMFSIIESCKMGKQVVEDYLSRLLDRLKSAREGEDLTSCLPCYLTE